MTQALSALLARLEAATGPDRRLDFDLWAEITRPTGWPALGEPEENRARWFDTWKHDAVIPRYSESLDAAMTLAPTRTDLYVCLNCAAHAIGENVVDDLLGTWPAIKAALLHGLRARLAIDGKE